jgi:hypothetical protein
VVRGFDIAVPELRPEPKPASEIEDDRRICPCLTRRRHDGLAELDQRLRFRADLETDFERLALEGRRHGQHHIGEGGGRGHEQIGVGVKIERRQCYTPMAAIGLRQEHIGTEADEAAHRIGRALQDGPVQFAGGDDI